VKREAIVTMMTDLDACGDAVSWLRSLQPETTLRKAWGLCERGDWLLWWLERISCDPHWTTAAACACVRGVWPLLADERSRRSVEVAELWSQGLASDGELTAAGDAAWAAAQGAARAAEGYAAWAAAGPAARAAALAAAWDAARYAAQGAAQGAALAAAWAAAQGAAWAAAQGAAQGAALRSCACRVRKVIPWRIVERTMREHGARHE
jgi:hypothetical protein